MTKKRFVKYDGNTIIDLKLVKSWIISNGDVDLLIELLNEDINLSNELNEENKQLKKIIMELKTTIQFDANNGVKKYPVKNLLEYLENISKEIK